MPDKIYIDCVYDISYSLCKIALEIVFYQVSIIRRVFVSFVRVMLRTFYKIDFFKVKRFQTINIH